VIGGLIDEVAFLRSDDTAANRDEEILSALRAGDGDDTGGYVAVRIKPLRAPRALWNAYRRWHGKAGAPLVWRASTRTMNSTVPQRVIDEERERGPVRAAGEYDAEFRTDIDSFIAREAIEGSVVADRHELPRMTGMVYFGFADPSGWSSDGFTLGVYHRDKNGFVIVDCVQERRPLFSPQNVVREFSNVLKDYGLHRVAGDHYGGEWPRE
jgi:hypothetical protein